MNPIVQPGCDTLTLTSWEHLPMLSASAAHQMAVDAVLARLCSVGPPRALFRLYRMTPPAVTIGRHQRWRTVIDEAECRRRGWEWTRRPTGGGALLHHREINYAVAASRRIFGDGASFNHAYACIMTGLAAAVALLGGGATLNMGRGSVTTTSARSAHGLCGQSLTHYEIAVDGRKAVAAAQWFSTDAVLQHGTIYLQAPDPSDRFWPPTSESRVSQNHTPSWWDASSHTAFSDERIEAVTKALRDGLRQALGLTWIDTSYDQIDSQLIDGQLNEWISQDWDHHR